MDGNIALLTGTSIRNYELKQDACFIGSWIQMNVDETWTSGHQDTVVSHFAHGTCPSSSFSVQVGCLCGLWRAGPRSPCQAAQPWVSGSWTSRGAHGRRTFRLEVNRRVKKRPPWWEFTRFSFSVLLILFPIFSAMDMYELCTKNKGK